MALANYVDLKLAVADWLHRKDLTARIPDFIAMAEASINRRLKISPAEVETPVFMTIGSRFIPLPGNFGTPICLWLESNMPREKLTPALPSELPVDGGQSGEPLYWAIDGTKIAFDQRADKAYPLTLRYVQKFSLSDANQTNWLMTEAPDAYLYGALKEAAPYMRDDARIGIWENKFEQVIQEVKHRQNDRKSIAGLMTDPGLGGNSRFNINRGY